MFEGLCAFMDAWEDRSRWTEVDAPPARFSAFSGLGGLDRTLLVSETDQCSVTVCGHDSRSVFHVELIPVASCPLAPGPETYSASRTPATYQIDGLPSSLVAAMSAASDNRVTVFDEASGGLTLRPAALLATLHPAAARPRKRQTWTLTALDDTVRGAGFGFGGITSEHMRRALSRLRDDGYAITSITDLMINERLIVARMSSGGGVARRYAVPNSITSVLPVSPPEGTEPLNALLQLTCAALNEGIVEAQELMLDAYLTLPNSLALNDDCT